MKKLNLAACAAFVAGIIFMSCGNNAQNDSKEAADSLNEARTEQSSMPDSMNEGAANTAVAANEEDSKFAVEAADAGLTEVELGKLAQSKAAEQQVKDYGSMMVNDHAKANEALKALAQRKNITLPAVPGKDNQKIIDDMAKKTGKEFDKAYVDNMVKDHKKVVQLFEDGMTKVQDQDLKQFITNTLPTLKGHLEHIENIQKGRK
jgi:putative membrane protein